MAEDPKHPVETSRTTIRILRILHELERAGVTEVAESAGMHKSTVHNHLSTLQSEELVVRDGDEYALSLRLLEFGGRVRNQHSLYTSARQEIERLAEKTGESANLVVEQHGRGVYLLCERAENAVDLNLYPGLHRPLHCTASGKAILAHLPDERVDEIIDRHGLSASTERSITDRTQLEDRLDEIRDRGFAVDREEHISGVHCLGAPIMDGTGTVLGSVSVSVPNSRVDDEQLVDEIHPVVSSATNLIELHIQHS